MQLPAVKLTRKRKIAVAAGALVAVFFAIGVAAKDDDPYRPDMRCQTDDLDGVVEHVVGFDPDSCVPVR